MSQLKTGNGYVGIIARHRGKILITQRLEKPHVFNLPDGHCDGHSFGTACFINFENQTGLRVIGAPRPIVLTNPIKRTLCKDGCSSHDWRVFEVDWFGEIKFCKNKVSWIGWMSAEEMAGLSQKTETYLKRLKLAEQAEDQTMVDVIKESLQGEWMESPGLDETWYQIFKELKII